VVKSGSRHSHCIAPTHAAPLPPRGGLALVAQSRRRLCRHAPWRV